MHARNCAAVNAPWMMSFSGSCHAVTQDGRSVGNEARRVRRFVSWRPAAIAPGPSRVLKDQKDLTPAARSPEAAV
jgi:hypothetical protein